MLHSLVWISPLLTVDKPLHKEQSFESPSSRKTLGANGNFCSLKLPSNETHTFELPYKISTTYSVCWQTCLRQTCCPCLQYGCFWIFSPKPIIWEFGNYISIIVINIVYVPYFNSLIPGTHVKTVTSRSLAFDAVLYWAGSINSESKCWWYVNYKWASLAEDTNFAARPHQRRISTWNWRTRFCYLRHITCHSVRLAVNFALSNPAKWTKLRCGWRFESGAATV